MLSIYEFNLLPLQQKSQYIWDSCTYLTHRMESDIIRVNLYYAGKFNIEVWYNSDLNEIEKIQSFNALRLIEPYLAKIDTAFLFE